MKLNGHGERSPDPDSLLTDSKLRRKRARWRPIFQHDRPAGL